MQFAYDSAGSNTVGYQLRTNSTVWANKTGYTMNRRTLLFEVDGGLSGTATTIATGTTKTTVNFKYIPGGVIKYYSTSGSIAVDANFAATGLWDQYAIDLRYTFNTGSTLVSNGPVYMRCVINTDGTLTPDYTGSPKHPIAQVLPTTDDGKAYVYLGKAYSTSSMELYEHHPIYIFKNGKICLYTGVQSDWSASSGPTQILNKPTLGTAAAKDFTTSVTSGSTDLVTSGAVYTSLDSKADKVGPLPEVNGNVNTTISSIINGTSGKEFILKYQTGVNVYDYYLSRMVSLLIGTEFSFIKISGDNFSAKIVYYSGLNIQATTLGNLINDTYKHEVEITNNKVTSFSGTPNNNNYPTEKLVYDQIQSVRGIAEGKCKTYVLRYQATAPESDTQAGRYYYINENNELVSFQSLQEFETYIDGRSLLNGNFNSQNDNIAIFSGSTLGGYLILNELDGQDYRYRVIKSDDFVDMINTGDIIYVIETDVPDRWISKLSSSSVASCYVLETKTDLDDYVEKTDVPKYQATTIIVQNALTNINGRTFQNYTATLNTTNYTYYLIQKNGSNLTKEEASEYMKYMCGSEYVPEYNYDFPRNTLFIFADNSIWKPQFDTTNGLLLYKLSNGYVTIDGAQTIAGEKTFSGGIKLNQGNSIKLNSNTNVWELVGTDNYYLNIKCNNSPQYYIDSFTIMPNLNQDLGSTAYKWKDEYLNGQLKLYNGSNQTPHYWSFGTDADYSQLRTYYDGTIYYTTNTDGILPFGNNLSLGSSYFKWKNLYLSGQLSNGTDSIYISDIQEKIAIKRYI